MAIELREVTAGDKRTLRDFLEVTDAIFAGDANWVRPLDMDIKDRLSKDKNPFFEHGEADAWVAYRDGRAVGRISASIDRTHLERHGGDAGYFGFLDTIDDQEVVDTLIERAESWCRERDMKVIRGPFSLNINEEVGCQIEGFDEPPTIMMPHHRPYQAGLIEGAGFAKLKDFYSWRYDFAAIPKRALRGHKQISELPEVEARPVNMGDFAAEVRLIMDIFNDAWQDNWGFVPLSERELDKMAKDLKMIMIPAITRLVFIDGEPAAVAMAVPNINEILPKLHGKLSPIGIARLLWWLKVSKPRSGRLIILGVRKKYRSVRKYAGLSPYLFVEMNKSGAEIGMTTGELGWTLEDNSAVNVGIKMMGGKVCKTYRVFEKPLA